MSALARWDMARAGPVRLGSWAATSRITQARSTAVGLLEVLGGFAQVDPTGHDLWASPGGFVVGDLADSGAHLACCVDQV
jgi:hypothetical protein